MTSLPTGAIVSVGPSDSDESGVEGSTTGGAGTATIGAVGPVVTIGVVGETATAPGTAEPVPGGGIVVTLVLPAGGSITSRLRPVGSMRGMLETHPEPASADSARNKSGQRRHRDEWVLAERII